MKDLSVGDLVRFDGSDELLEVIEVPENLSVLSIIRMQCPKGTRIVRCEYGAFMDGKIRIIQSPSHHKTSDES
jgi:hypothetical protein